MNDFKDFNSSLGKPKKKSSLKGRAIKKGGGGVKGWAIKEKIIFFGTIFSNVPTFHRPLSPRGEGG